MSGVALHGLVILQIVQRDQPAVGRHGRGQHVRRFALIEFLGAVFRDPRQRLRQIGKSDEVALIVEVAVPQKDALRFRRFRARLRDLSDSRERVRCGEALRRHARWRAARSSAHFCLPYFFCAISKPRTVPGTPEERQPSMLSRVSLPLASRYMLRDALPGASSRKSMNVVRPSAIRISHESAAAEVARERMRHGQRESHCDRGVHGVAALLQDFDSRLLGGVRGHDHRMMRADGFARFERRGTHEKEYRGNSRSGAAECVWVHCLSVNRFDRRSLVSTRRAWPGKHGFDLTRGCADALIFSERARCRRCRLSSAAPAAALRQDDAAVDDDGAVPVAARRSRASAS